MTETATTIEGPPEDAIYFLSPGLIDPDPEQPRLRVDADLAASIAEQGVHQAITVRPHPTSADRFMIVDGERRWRGSVAAKAKEIPARVRLDLEGKLERLIVQVSTASGKQLTAIEQARAFKQMLEADATLTHAKLADRLGIPKSTVGDRIRLLDIDPVWTDLIVAGKLQLSHAPIIHKYRAVGPEYQKKAAAALLVDYRARRFLDAGDAIPVDDFKHLIYVAFRDYIKALSDVPGYKGPVIVIEGRYGGYNGGSEEKYAADIALWRPIFRKRENARRKRQTSGSTQSYARQQPDRIAKAVKASPDVEIPVRKTKEFYAQPRKGETEVFDDATGWRSGLNPAVLLEKLEPKDIIIIQGAHGAAKVVTTNSGAIEEARTAFDAEVRKAAEKSLAPFRVKLTDAEIAKYAVAGPGVVFMLQAGHFNEVKVIALALGLELGGSLDELQDEYEEGDVATKALHDRREDAERIASAIAAVQALDLKVPTLWQVERDVAAKLGKAAFAIPGATVSKKQSKRAARARGEQVGDPSRAAAAPAPEVAAAP
jgi:ParB/RepB/Spo0J family partition protein